jgi:PPK2 family polyphosphate:nucleotide phosphotransferase
MFMNPSEKGARLMGHAIKVDGTKQQILDDIDPGANGGMKKEEGQARFAELGEEMRELQELLYAAGDHSMLVVLQGRDTSGKDGTIRKVFDYVNPQGCRVESFKVPTAQELAHDFLWRCHKATPALGMITVFNRSHYEDVLVVRVHNLVPEEQWRRRYDHINNFERLLIDDNKTIILKFCLHISKEEQEERLLAREQEVTKAWKLSAGDWKEREFWDDYTAAYDEALHRCSTEDAPWYVVPANRKWFRDLAIAETIVKTLRPFRERWLAALEEQGRIAKGELQEYRAGKGQSA